MTREQVAEFLQVNVRTVDRLIKSGKLKAFKVGQQVRIEQADLDAYIEQQKTSAQQ